jgi:Zn-dependent peptidase ImmA (M78 family)
MHQKDKSTDNDPAAGSVLGRLRRLVPPRPTSFGEALRIAELQASYLVELTGDDPAGLEAQIAGQPRIRIDYRPMPTSGLSYWEGELWLICLNSSEPETRQRFTLLHEYKHILDHGRTNWLFTGSPTASPEAQAEQAADYFAGCALVPKRLLKRAWGDGIQRPRDLAELFDVSQRAIEVRLAQVGLVEQADRCTGDHTSWRPAPRRSGRYERQKSPAWLLGQLTTPHPMEVAA